MPQGPAGPKMVPIWTHLRQTRLSQMGSDGKSEGMACFISSRASTLWLPQPQITHRERDQGHIPFQAPKRQILHNFQIWTHF